MLNSDKKTIKNNLINYAKGKGNYKSLKLKINWNIGYKITYNEQGYQTKEGMILTDRFLYEFIVFSKKDIENEFNVLILASIIYLLFKLIIDRNGKEK